MFLIKEKRWTDVVEDRQTDRQTLTAVARCTTNRLHGHLVIDDLGQPEVGCSKKKILLIFVIFVICIFLYAVLNPKAEPSTATCSTKSRSKVDLVAVHKLFQ